MLLENKNLITDCNLGIDYARMAVEAQAIDPDMPGGNGNFTKAVHGLSHLGRKPSQRLVAVKFVWHDLKKDIRAWTVWTANTLRCTATPGLQWHSHFMLSFYSCYDEFWGDICSGLDRHNSPYSG